jgi:hypothetical protein
VQMLNWIKKNFLFIFVDFKRIQLWQSWYEKNSENGIICVAAVRVDDINCICMDYKIIIFHSYWLQLREKKIIIMISINMTLIFGKAWMFDIWCILRKFIFLFFRSTGIDNDGKFQSYF